MKEVYVHTLRYHYYGWGYRKSRTMFPISYGPFGDEDSAREWIRQSGLLRATKLMSGPAKENIRVSPGRPSGSKPAGRAAFLDTKTQPGRSA